MQPQSAWISYLHRLKLKHTFIAIEWFQINFVGRDIVNNGHSAATAFGVVFSVLTLTVPVRYIEQTKWMTIVSILSCAPQIINLTTCRAADGQVCVIFETLKEPLKNRLIIGIEPLKSRPREPTQV